jgi:hypothetical protein
VRRRPQVSARAGRQVSMQGAGDRSAECRSRMRGSIGCTSWRAWLCAVSIQAVGRWETKLRYKNCQSPEDGCAAP